MLIKLVIRRILVMTTKIIINGGPSWGEICTIVSYTVAMWCYKIRTSRMTSNPT